MYRHPYYLNRRYYRPRRRNAFVTALIALLFLAFGCSAPPQSPPTQSDAEQIARQIDEGNRQLEKLTTNTGNPYAARPQTARR